MSAYIKYTPIGIGGGGGGGGGTPGGANTDVQYNNAGVFGGNSGFTYDGVGDVNISGQFTAAGFVVGQSGLEAPLLDIVGVATVTIQAPDAGLTAYNLNLPNTAGTSGYFLTSAGGGSAPMTWTAPSSLPQGTVTSVALAAPALFTVSGSPVTSAGTLTLSYSGSALPIANGGTAATTAAAAFNNLSPLTTAGDITYELSAGVAARLGIGATGNVLTVVGGLPAWSAPSFSGTVTSVSVVSANGLAGTVATATTTPAITLSTTLTTPVIAGNGTALIAATTTGTGSTVMLNAGPTFSGTMAGASETLSGTLVATGAISGSNLTSAGHASADIANALLTTTGDTIYASSASTPARLGIGATGNVLTVAAGIPSWAAPATSGTVTAVSVASANGFAGTSSGGATPALTLTTTLTTPVIAGNGTAIVAATTTGTGSTVALNAGPTFTGTIAAASETLSGTLVATGAISGSNLTAAGHASADIANALLTTTGDTIYASAASTPARLAIGSTGNVLTVAGGIPSWAAPATSGTVTNFVFTNGDNVTGTVGTSTTTPTLSLAPTSATPAATSFASWDASKNLSANNHIQGFTVTATAAGSTTMTIASTYENVWTGTTTQTILLPTTSVPAGLQYLIINNSTGALTVQSSGANTITGLPAGTQGVFTALVATPTTAANWNAAVSMNGVILGTTPTIQKFTSGTAATYTTPAGVAYISVRMVGGGGGGSGGGANTTFGNGGNGTASTFGTSLLSAGGGTGGIDQASGSGGAGGTSSLGSGPIGTATTGNPGAAGNFNNAASSYPVGGLGGTTIFGGSSANALNNTVVAGAANTGAGGAGGAGSATAATFGGYGGGAGGLVTAIIATPASTYTYTIGAAGAAGTAGTNGNAGAAGSTGYLEVTEFYSNLAVSSTLATVNPTIQKFTSSTGNYTTPSGVAYISVKMVGGGGGGGGGGTGSSGTGGAGGATTFGASLLSAGGGAAGGGQGGSGGAGGTSSLGTAIGTALPGGAGMGCTTITSGDEYACGGSGGSGAFGGAGTSSGNQAGTAGGTNTGAGGAGGGTANVSTIGTAGGCGGGSGGYISAIIFPTAAQVFAYAIGAAGTAGTAGTSGFAGGAGGSGYIEVTEVYSAVAVGTSTAISANLVLAGPTSGSAATPTFRSLVPADITTISARYYASATSISGALATINWTTQDYDTNSAMSSGTYTIPVAGKYHINSAILITGTIALNNNIVMEIQKNGTVVSRFTEFFPATLTDGKAIITDIINCAASDTIRIQVSSSVTAPSIVSSNFDNYFSIAMLGK